MSYSADLLDDIRRARVYPAKILRGATLSALADEVVD